jgi:hypothetical protein
MPSTLIFFHGTSRVGMEFAPPGQFSFETAKLTRMQHGRATKGVTLWMLILQWLGKSLSLVYWFSGTTSNRVFELATG